MTDCVLEAMESAADFSEVFLIIKLLVRKPFYWDAKQMLLIKGKAENENKISVRKQRKNHFQERIWNLANFAVSF